MKMDLETRQPIEQVYKIWNDIMSFFVSGDYEMF